MPNSSKEFNRLRVTLLKLISFETLDMLSTDNLYDLRLLLLYLADQVKLKGAEKTEDSSSLLTTTFDQNPPRKVD